MRRREAGSAIALDLVSAGVTVRGFDPAQGARPDGVEASGSAAEAAQGADAVLSLNAAGVAADAAVSVAAGLSGGVLFADLNTTAPSVKRAVGEVVAGAGGSFADVALLGPVPGRGLRTPALASGPGAERFAQIFAELAGKGQAIVMVTHDIALAQRAERMITMEDGLVVSDSLSASGERELNTKARRHEGIQKG